jgi:hypothetical protein
MCHIVAKTAAATSTKLRKMEVEKAIERKAINMKDMAQESMIGLHAKTVSAASNNQSEILYVLFMELGSFEAK